MHSPRGNPFFVEEVLKSLVSAGAIFYADGQWDRKPLGELDIPRSIQITVQQRADRLNPEARHLLTLAAVAGRRFDFALLLRLTEYGDAKLLPLIKDLMAAQFVVEESAERFAFRHALTREALYADLLIRERTALHGQIAEALEALVSERGPAARTVWAADLAYHFYMAGIWPKAVAYAQQAGEQARRLHVPRAAIEHLSRAIEAARQLDQAPLSALYRTRGQMHEILGAFEAARDDYQTALVAAQAAGDRQIEWQALLDLGFLWAERDYLQMGEYRQRALDLARTLDDPISLGHSLNRVGNWHLFVEQPNEALRYHQEALALFQAANDRPGLAATYDLMGVTQIMAGDIPTAVEQYEHAVALFRELGDRQGLVSSLAALAMRGASYPFNTTLCPPSDWAACLADGQEALRLAREIGWRSGEANTLIYLAYAYGPRGDYAPALKCAWAGLEVAQEIEHGVWLFSAHLALGVIALDLLDLATARQRLEQAMLVADEIGSFFARIAAGFLASTCVVQRDVARAEEVLAAALDAGTPMETCGQRLAWCARAELALAAGEPVLALQIVDRLIASAGQIERYGQGCVPRLWHLQGTVLTALGRLDEAEAALDLAGAAAERWGLRPTLWRVQASLGRLHQSWGHRKQAQAAFTAARAIVDDLAATITPSSVRETFLRGAAEHIPQPVRPTPRRAAKETFDGLTERERDVATLIAQGHSNREIAAALVVGERTVETHISNILSKLSFTSRHQVAAWATRKNLANRAE
jgi:DNA-binding CsgD family transcriptional regulator/tetratricopeptide (TPR) repeat protein